MARLLWCRREDCRKVYVSEAGYMPSICPKCERAARWTTTAPMDVEILAPLEWSVIDRIVLIYLGIGP